MPLSPILRHLVRMALAGVLACGVVALPAGRMPPVAAEIGAAGPAVPGRLAVGSQRDLVGALEPGRAVRLREVGALEPGRAARIRALIGDLDDACLPAAAAGEPALVPGVIAQAARALRVSPVGSWLLQQAAARGVLICLDGGTEFAAYYRAQLRLIGLQATLPPAAATLFLAHELAHVPQHPSYSNHRDFAVDDLILMHRMREASAEAIATRVLWQMHRLGRSEAWQAKLATGYGDIARAFAAAMARAAEGDRAAGARAELQATRAAFEQWFASSPRLQQYDSHMLDHLERLAQDRPGPVSRQRRLSDSFLRGIARHAGDTFLAAAALRPLTGARYRAGLSGDNAARLTGILGAGAARLASDAAALPDDPAALPD